MNRLISATLLIPALLMGGAATAQLRAGEPLVLDQPPTPAPMPPDIIGPFKSQYRAAGEPRILLFWNVAFDDETAMSHEEVATLKRSASESSNDLDKNTQGPAGDAALSEHDGKSSAREERVKTTVDTDHAKVRADLDAAHAAQLETVFRQQLHGAGVHLLDRATSMRFTAAQRDRDHVDAKLIESDAVLGKADVLLEVLMIPDPAAPLHAGFKVSATRIKDGLELVTFYTVARPSTPPAPGHYVATDHGFLWQPPRPPTIGINDIAITLAGEILERVGAALPAG